MTQSTRRVIFTADSRFAVAKADGKPVTLSGYALVWNVLSSDRGGYKVRLLPGSATFAEPTLALFHHDFRHVIGNTENGTLRITPDSYGVKVEIDLPDTSTGRDVYTLVRDKYIRGMSFAMATSPRGRTVKEDGQEILEAEAFECDEITVTAAPAFTQTTIDIKPDAAQPSYSARVAQAIELERHRLGMCTLPASR